MLLSVPLLVTSWAESKPNTSQERGRERGRERRREGETEGGKGKAGVVGSMGTQGRPLREADFLWRHRPTGDTKPVPLLSLAWKGSLPKAVGSDRPRSPLIGIYAPTGTTERRMGGLNGWQN